MAKLHNTLEVFAQDLRDHCSISPDLDLLQRVTLSLGPQALNPKTLRISEKDLAKVVASFMSSHNLPQTLQGEMTAAIKDAYPAPQRYRAVIAYLIAQNFGLRGRR